MSQGGEGNKEEVPKATSLVCYAGESSTSERPDESVNPADETSKSVEQETKEFLQFWLKSTAKTDVIDILKENISQIEKLNPDNVQECEAALMTLSEYVGNIDIANDLYKIGGFSVFNLCLSSEEDCLRWRCAELIADLSQNNPVCQDKIVEAGILALLIGMLDTDCSEKVKIKSLYAISCIIRDNDMGYNEFIKHDGCSGLLRALQSGVLKLIMKTAFLLGSLVQQRPQLKVELINMGFVEQLMQLIADTTAYDNRSEYQEVSEHLLLNLLCLVRDSRESQHKCLTCPIDLKQVLQSILEQDGEFIEQHSYAKELMNILYTDVDDDYELTVDK